jgi:arylsulfatase A-like enzyme
MEENLGTGSFTDFITISFSTPDYIGHAYGPNSLEQEDIYLRLDHDLGELLRFLDTRIGKNQYLLFLSADHGAAHAPWFLQEHNIPSGNVSTHLADTLNKALRNLYGRDSLVTQVINYQVCLNRPLINRLRLNKKAITQTIDSLLQEINGIERVFDIEEVNLIPLPSHLRELANNGYYPNRSGDIQIIYTPQWIEGFENGGTTHGVWNPYDTHIPLLWYGWHIKPGSSKQEVRITDIAPTLAALLHIQMPSGCIGKVIEEVGR